MTTSQWWSVTMLAAALCVSPAAADEPPAGRAVYLRYCSACHGSDGKGDGIVATVMRPKPADLTLLSKTHGGQFPRALVANSIDGRQRLAAHGETDMPVWGEIFADEKGSTLTAQGEVRGQVQLITDYLRTIQVP
jgi:mono/diheme cytochrome c family protein